MYLEDFHRIVSQTRQEIRDAIDRNLSHPEAFTACPTGLLVRFRDRFVEFAKSGKLLRGVLATTIYRAGGGSESRVALDCAAALEMIHSSILVHDDILDRDDVRRGSPTFHRWFERDPDASDVGEADHYGLGLALAAGDMGVSWGYHVLAGLQVPATVTVRLLKLVTAEIIRVNCAQMYEFRTGLLRTNPDVPEIMSVYADKTGRYSMVMPMTVGAELAHTDDAIVKLLRAYGAALGLLYQLKDDELAVFGDTGTTGKAVGNDVRENKKTVLRQLLMRNLRGRDRQKAESMFGKSDLGRSDIDQLKDLIDSSGTGRKLAHLMDSLQREAEDIVQALPYAPAYKRFLLGLAEYCRTRSS